MAFWSGETLAEKLPSLIEPFDRDAIDCAAYTLHVGGEVYVSPDREVAAPSRHTKQMLEPGGAFAIPPGQFSFLIAEEVVAVPDDALAFISIKARQKFGGLINISGFHVDPGYRGRLLFSVLNAGPKPLHLVRGQPLFLIWYADLDQATQEKKRLDDGHGGIDPRFINDISGEILSLQSLSEKQRALESDLNRKLQEQTTTVSNLRLLVTLLLGAVVALVVGLTGWALRGWIGGP